MARATVTGFSMMANRVDFDRLRITVAGELDLHTAHRLLDAVAEAMQFISSRDLVLDLSGVTFLDASGVGALVRARQICRHVGGRLTVFGARGIVAEVLHLTGVAEALGVSMRAPAGSAPAAIADTRETDGPVDR